MVKFFRGWCEELILSSFIISILEMLVPEGKTKKYIRVVTGVYIIFVILNPILLKLDKVDIEQELSNILEVSEGEFNSEIELEKSYEILNTISENLQMEVNEDVGEIQE